MDVTKPVKLTPGRAWRTYIGGSQIDRIHGIEGGADTQFPEEWIMSTTAARNAGREDYPDEGMCFLDHEDSDGRKISLPDYISNDPERILGKAHFEKYGCTTGVLVKIIDAGERLTIQAHPSKEKARELFHSDYGKTECWYIIGGREINGEKPCIYMGFKEGITRQAWKECFDTQNIPQMLGWLNKFEVKPEETYLIHGGVAHAIGAGCLLVEIQEPTDYSIRTERVTPNGLKVADFMCHQGLGFDKMFDVFDYTGRTAKQAHDAWCIPPRVLAEDSHFSVTEVIGYRQTECFRMEKIEIEDRGEFHVDGIFSGLYCLSGRGELDCGGIKRDIASGDQFFIPASCGDFSIEALQKMVLFRCYGPKV